jgi:hypothetical protein
MDWLSKLPTLSDIALTALRDNARRISSGEAAPPPPAPEKRKAGQAPRAAATLKPDAQLIATAGELLPAIEAELAVRRVRHREELKSRPRVPKPPRKVVDDY